MTGEYDPSPKTPSPERQCTVEPVVRVNCGRAGISPTECFNKGCCYNNMNPDAIWCFYARPDDECLL
ncbi:unnamed protein product [Ranitomeya imitator]|uniref:P-type domain-containing protein n=1 Tax=Ranitomeya imitator TaxID=111125 RepID=A0ABN9M8K2_9NEOB|nr:unnamed protein product [Ranitomeya imitator]